MTSLRRTYLCWPHLLHPFGFFFGNIFLHKVQQVVQLLKSFDSHLSQSHLQSWRCKWPVLLHYHKTHFPIILLVRYWKTSSLNVRVCHICKHTSPRWMSKYWSTSLSMTGVWGGFPAEPEGVSLDASSWPCMKSEDAENEEPCSLNPHGDFGLHLVRFDLHISGTERTHGRKAITSYGF